MTSRFQQFVDELVTTLDDPLLTASNVVMGRRETASHRAAPSLVLIPEGGPIVSPDRVGASEVSTGSKVRIIALRQCTIEVQCHGRTEEETEDLLHTAYRAVRTILHSSWSGEGQELWPDQDDGADGFARHGRLAAFTFTWHIPIYDESKPLTVITGFEESETFADEPVDCNE